jgi:hypothetical protein
MRWIVMVLAVGAFFTSNVGNAQDLDFDDIDKSELESLVSDFGSNFSHTTASGASSLGRIFGFEVGIVLGASKTPNIEDLSKEQDSAADAAALPYAGIEGQISIPFGLTVEANIIPETGDTDDIQFQNTGLGLKWTMTDGFLVLPLNLALKAAYTKTELSFVDTLDGANATIDIETTSFSAGLLASLNFMILEPYIGIGFIDIDGDLSVDGTGQIFDSAFTTSNTASAGTSGGTFTLGTELKLFIFKFGIEYSKIVDAERFVGKFAFYF